MVLFSMVGNIFLVAVYIFTQIFWAKATEKEMIFRDCVARKARRACRVFMCADITCVFFTTDQKEIALHKLAHDNTLTVQYCQLRFSSALLH
jgi:hypothetical protein